MFKLFKSTENKTKEFFEKISNEEIVNFSLIVNQGDFTAQWKTNNSKCAVQFVNNLGKYTSLAGDTFNSKEFRDEAIELINRTLLNKFENAKEQIHKFPNIEAPTEGELKGEEWLRVTNTVLTKSYEKALNDKELLVQGNLFIGKLSDELDFSLRYLSYNLDYKIDFLNNGKVFLNVYDDKNLERGSVKKSSYSGEFYNNRPVVLDTMLTLISSMLNSSTTGIFRISEKK